MNIAMPSLSDTLHAIGERCTLCERAAFRKVGEYTSDSMRHEYTAYLCEYHFRKVMKIRTPVVCGCSAECEWTLMGDEYWWACPSCGALVTQEDK